MNPHTDSWYKQDMSNSLLTIKQAARELGVSTKTIRRWETQGKIESIRTQGGHRRFKLKDVAPDKAITLKKIAPHIIITIIISSTLTFLLTKNHFQKNIDTLRLQLDTYINSTEQKPIVITDSSNQQIIDSGVGAIKPTDEETLLIEVKSIKDSHAVKLIKADDLKIHTSQILSGIGFIITIDNPITSPQYFNWEVLD